MLLTAALATAELGLNRLLALDLTAQTRLARLQGKVLAIHSPSPAFTLYLLPHDQGIRLATHWEAPADCTLTAPVSRLLNLALSRHKTEVLHSADLDLEGDSALFLELAGILQSLDLDWEYQLSKWFGPVASGLIGSHLRSRVDWARNSVTSLRQDLADYLAEESRQLVGETEAQARFNEIDDLKLALDRLEARVELISSRSEPDA